MRITTGLYVKSIQLSNGTDWFHIAFNYVFNQGITAYHDGVLAVNDTSLNPPRPLGGNNSQIALGVFNHPSIINMFVSMKVDELLFFNHSLNASEISVLSQSST